MSLNLLVAFALFVCVLGQPDCPTWCNALYNASFISACGITPGNGAAFSSGNVSDCITYCNTASIPAGTAADTSGNTLGCRIYHAGVAAGIAGTYNQHCDHPTLSSANATCGDWCPNYCMTMMNPNACGGMYPDSTTCNTVCTNAFSTAVSPGYVVNSNLPANWQDNVACRTYHGSLPSILGGSAVHCPHAYITGGGACISGGDTKGCNALCTLLISTCTGYLEVSGDTVASCVTRCKANTQLALTGKYLFNDTAIASGCSVDCRAYHLINAIKTGLYSTHCPHAFINAASGTPCACAGSTTASTTAANGLVAAVVLMAGSLLALVFI